MRILWKKFLLLAPLAILVIGLNTWVDPGNILNKGRTETQMAATLTTGLNCAANSDVDERLLREALIEQSAIVPEVVVFGSSRSLQIRASHFPGFSFMNCAVPMVDIEDMIGLHAAFLGRKTYPRYFIIGVEPWMLSENFDRPRYVSLYRVYGRGLRDMNLEGGISRTEYLRWRVSPLVELVSPAYLSVALRALPRILRAPSSNIKFEPTTDSVGNGWIWLADGSLAYERGVQEASVAEVTKQALNAIASGKYKGYGSEPPGRSRIEKFEALIAAFRNHGATVFFLLAPFHPLFYEQLCGTADFTIVGDAERYYRTLAFERNIPLAGSFNPDSCNAQASDFFDEVHPRPAFLQRLLNQLLVQDPSQDRLVSRTMPQTVQKDAPSN